MIHAFHHLQQQWDEEAARSPEPMPCARPTTTRMAGGIAALLLVFIAVTLAIAAFVPGAGQ